MATEEKELLDLAGLKRYNNKVASKIGLVEGAIDAEIETRIAIDSNLQTQINGLASGAPVPVASTDAMTDITKIYVNTSDGEWYYWNSNSSTWTSGGTYQATSLGLGSVDFDNLSPDLAKSVYGFSTDVSALSVIFQNMQTGSFNITCPMLLKSGTTITVSSSFVANYHWNLRKLKANLMEIDTALFSETTDTSYTMQEDGWFVFSWRPIDDNWSSTTYTVNRRHRLTNSDVLSILYFYPKTEYNQLIDLDINQIHGTIFGCTAESGTGGVRFIFQKNRAANGVLYKSNYDIVVELTDQFKDDYQFSINTWTVTDADTWSRTSDTGWVTTRQIIPAGSIFSILYRKSDNTNLTDVTDIKKALRMYSYASLNYIRDYVDANISGSTGTYNYEGLNLDLQFKHGYEKEDIFDTTLLTTSSQAFDIYGNYIVQLYNGGLMNILDKTTGEEVGVFSTSLGFQHGDCCQFSNTFYDENDLFPLLYITSDSTPAIVYVMRIASLSSATIIKSYLFDSGAGYYAGHAIDFDNNLVYMIGYKENSFTDGTNNASIISVYDLSQETLVSGTQYSLQLLDRYEKPFIFTMQGMKFMNGLIYIVSSYDPAMQKTYIYVYDPIRKMFVAKFTNMPSDIANYETEDVAFIKGEYKYEMVVGTRHKYMKLSFK